MDHSFHLNDMVCKGGCGAKIEPGLLNSILKDMPAMPQDMKERLIVGFDTDDDACVYKLTDDIAIVQTVDFFPPPIDDPYLFGRIAATNAISDIYAMGADPVMAVNLLTFPCSMDKEAVSLILKGGYDTAIEAGVAIGGGHSIDDKEPKYGMCVIGITHPDKVYANSHARIGDAVVITKKLGVGIYTVASRGRLLDDADEEKMVAQMTRLNKNASQCAHDYDVHACTDVTGFGLVGHALEMANASNVSIEFDIEKIPILDKAISLAKDGMIPTGAYQNRKLICDGNVIFDKDIDLPIEDIMFDPQTSGGLMLTLSEPAAREYVKKMNQIGDEAYIVGYVVPRNSYAIRFLQNR